MPKRGEYLRVLVATLACILSVGGIFWFLGFALSDQPFIGFLGMILGFASLPAALEIDERLMNKGETRKLTNEITDTELLRKICILLCGIDRSDDRKSAECLERAIGLAETYLLEGGEPLLAANGEGALND